MLKYLKDRHLQLKKSVDEGTMLFLGKTIALLRSSQESFQLFYFEAGVTEQYL